MSLTHAHSGVPTAEETPTGAGLAALLARPELFVLAEGLAIEPFRAPAGAVVSIRENALGVDEARLGQGRDAALLLHFALEFALYRQIESRPDFATEAAHVLCAALSTTRLIGLQPSGEQWATPDWLSTLSKAALSDTPVSGIEAVITDGLAFLDRRWPSEALDLYAVWRRLARLRPLAAPAVGLLLEGSDSRIDLDSATGTNIYGCAALPDPTLISFASSTANPVTLRSARAAEALRRHWLAAASEDRFKEALRASSAEIRKRLCAALGLGAGEGITVVLAASGTVATLLAGYVGVHAGRPICAIMLGVEETGTGVAAAVAGCHPAARTPMGVPVTIGAPVADDAIGATRVERIPIRDLEGRPVLPALLHRQIIDRIEDALRNREAPVLHAVVSSKTGLVVPGAEIVRSLRNRYGEKLAFVVDACQMRALPVGLRGYFDAGAIVVATGSKFLGGPAFAGVLLIPNFGEPTRVTLPRALAAYSSCNDWPESGGEPVANLRAAPNVGLVLRWEAALAESAPFFACSDDAIAVSVANFRETVEESLARATEVKGLACPAAPKDSALGSIVSFSVTHPVDGRALTSSELRRIYGLMRRDLSSLLPAAASDAQRAVAQLRCLIGQPVVLRADGDAALAVLRISACAALIAELAAPEKKLRRKRRAALRRDVDRVVDKLMLILRDLPPAWIDSPPNGVGKESSLTTGWRA